MYSKLQGVQKLASLDGALTDLVEAVDVERAALVDAVGTDAEDLAAAQAPLREHDADRHGGRKRRRDDDGDEVKAADDHDGDADLVLDLCVYKHDRYCYMYV